MFLCWFRIGPCFFSLKNIISIMKIKTKHNNIYVLGHEKKVIELLASWDCCWLVGRKTVTGLEMNKMQVRKICISERWETEYNSLSLSPWGLFRCVSKRHVDHLKRHSYCKHDGKYGEALNLVTNRGPATLQNYLLNRSNLYLRKIYSIKKICSLLRPAFHENDAFPSSMEESLYLHAA